MARTVVLLSIPGLRSRDLGTMPRLLELSRKGVSVPLRPSFPALTAPVQANMTTGVGPEKHGVIGNSFYWRDQGQAELRAARNEVVQAPQIWELLKERDASLLSALWFTSLSEGAKADIICTPPVHRPNGSEPLRCSTRPAELDAALRQSLNDFPIDHFRGPQSSVQSTAWIVDSFVQTAYSLQPRFSMVALPHLDQAAKKFGPDSPEALDAVAELDLAIGALVDGFTAARIRDVTWLAASEYCISPVSSVGFPNRVLREAGLLTAVMKEDGEHLVLRDAPAFAMVDHQIAHVFVRDPGNIDRVADLFRNDPTVAEVLTGSELSRMGLQHPRSGEVVLIAAPEAWFAYYWWLEDAKAPAFARTSHIQQKPGDDPVEMFASPGGTTPLDAALVKGSHGGVADDRAREGVLVSSAAENWFSGKEAGIRDVDIARLVLSLFET